MMDANSQQKDEMWRRALAFLIDLVPLMILVGFENYFGLVSDEDDGFVGLLNLLLLLGYFAGLNYQDGATPGKRLMGLRVALPSSPDVPVRLITRPFVKIVCLAPPFSIIYGLIAIWREDGRSLADFVAGSTVIEASSYAPPQQASVPERVIASCLMLMSPCICIIILVPSLFGLAVIEQLLSCPHCRLSTIHADCRLIDVTPGNHYHSSIQTDGWPNVGRCAPEEHPGLVLCWC